MRKFGLVGGTTWRSTVDYYSHLHELVNAHFGGNVNPPLYLANLNHSEVQRLQQLGDWTSIGQLLTEKCRELESIGCAGLAFCANTPHRMHDVVQAAVGVPVVHVGDAIGGVIRSQGHRVVGLLGTRYTMEGGFIKDRLAERFSVDVLTPDESACLRIQDAIHDEMSHGVFSQEMRDYFSQLIAGFRARGAEAVVLGCTEFPILLRDVEVDLPKIDSTRCHTAAIVDFLLS